MFLSPRLKIQVVSEENAIDEEGCGDSSWNQQ